MHPIVHVYDEVPDGGVNKTKLLAGKQYSEPINGGDEKEKTLQFRHRVLNMKYRPPDSVSLLVPSATKTELTVIGIL